MLLFVTVVELRALLGAITSRTLVGITGPPGAGKTHVARFLGHPVVAMDGFHLPNDELRRIGRRQRKGAPDTFDAAAFLQLLDHLRNGTVAVSVPAFSRELDEPVAVNVLEGVSESRMRYARREIEAVTR